MVSTRASEMTGGGTPLREFTGKFVDLEVRAENDKKRCFLNFTGVKVIKSETPYNYPVAQIGPINYSDSKRGAWGMLLTSLEPLGHDDLMELKDQNVRMTAEEHVYNPDRKPDEKEIKGIVWRVAEILGATSTSASGPVDVDSLLKYLDGENASGFAQKAFADPVAKKNSSTIFDGSLLTTWLADGKATKDGEVYHVVKK